MNTPLFIAGPCVIESYELLDTVAKELVRLNRKYHLNIIFKSSFDKANRTSIYSYRGRDWKKDCRCFMTLRVNITLIC